MNYFPRGTGPLLSVMIPTRHRPDLLKRCIASFLDLATNPESVDFIVKVDDDDPDSLRAASALPGRVLVHSTPRGRGYADLHLHWNHMLGWARGDWLFPCNDDAAMHTKGWDDILRDVEPFALAPHFEGSPDVCLLNWATEDGRHTTVFPVVRRAAHGPEGTRRISLNAHQDAYLQEIYDEVGARIDMPTIRFEHTFNRHGLKLFSSEPGGSDVSWPEFGSEECRVGRALDAGTLRRLLGRPEHPPKITESTDMPAAGWESWKPLMVRALQNTRGAVLELGAGHSTAFLDRLCATQDRLLVTMDTSDEWLDRFRGSATGRHEFVRVKSWGDTPMHLPGQCDRRWGVALIDHAPGERRRHEIARLRQTAEVLIVHDTEPEARAGYGFSEEEWRKQFRFIRHDTRIGVGAWATALSNYTDVGAWVL